MGIFLLYLNTEIVTARHVDLMDESKRGSLFNGA